MSRSIPALVNPPLLVWAREQAGFMPEEVASHLGQKNTSKLIAWERGEGKPTLNQARQLAQIYHRPLGVFFLNEPPQESPLGAEYRRLPGVRPGHESPELRLALRQILNKREIGLELFDDLRAQPRYFDLGAHAAENPETVAARLRIALNIPGSIQIDWHDEFEAWRNWRTAVENLGVLVFQFPKVSLDEVRGLSILRYPLPVIGINGKEIPLSKPFTLMHELVHLMLGRADEEKSALDDRNSDAKWEAINRFAEKVAAATLLPASDILNEQTIAQHPDDMDWDLHLVRKLARRYKVTPSALATRLLDLGKMTPATYSHWRSAWETYQRDHPVNRGGGIATPAAKAINRNGLPFTKLILEALRLDRITSVDAANYLGLRFSHFGELQRELAGPAFSR